MRLNIYKLILYFLNFLKNIKKERYNLTRLDDLDLIKPVNLFDPNDLILTLKTYCVFCFLAEEK